MANRVSIQNSPPRIVISKPGFNAANPNLNDNNKVFDSDWSYAGALVLCGYYEFTAPSGGGVRWINYPKNLGYRPMVYAWRAERGGSYIDFGDPVGSALQVQTHRVGINMGPSNQTRGFVVLVIGA